MKHKTELKGRIERLTEAGLHIRSSIGRPSHAERQTRIKSSRDISDKTKLSTKTESGPQLSNFVPILPKPTNFTFAVAVQATQPVLEEKCREATSNFLSAVAVRPARPTLEERCKDMHMSLPDLSNAKEHPIEKTKCVVVHCDHSQERNPDLYFFPFPKEARRCAMWLINCDRLDLFKKDLPTISNQCIVCEDHFAINQYYVHTLFRDIIPSRKKRLNQYYIERELFPNSAPSEIPERKKRLIYNAVPTLFNIPSRPPKKNSRMPELHETSMASVQEQFDDLQVILLPPSPKQQTNGLLDTHINGDIEMDNDDYHSDSIEKDLIFEINEQNATNSNSDFCVNIPTEMDIVSSYSGISLYKEENLTVVKRQRLNSNNYSDKYIAMFDIAKTIRSVLEKKAEPKYRSWVKGINEMKAFGEENSFQEKKIAVDNAFKAIEDDIRNMIAELQARRDEVIDISDDEIQESTLPEGIVISPLPRLRSSLNTTNKRPLSESLSTQTMAQKSNNSLQIDRNSLTSADSTDIIQIAQISITRPNLPSIGPVRRREVVPGMQVIASKLSFLHSWCRAVVLDVLNGTQGDKLFRIRFEGKKNGGSLCTGKQLAYIDNPKVILPVGSRVVAAFKRELKEVEIHAGIVAEPPKVMNNYRYLIFFDSGHAQYVTHKEIYLVCEAGKEVWEDVLQESKEFIKGYLMQYPERPMVKLLKGQIVNTELNGTWLSAHVKDVDASLVKLEFENKQIEWIYRGSTRLAPLYNELANAQANRLTGKFRRHHLMGKRAHQPYVEYTRGIDEPIARPIQNTAVVTTNLKTSTHNVDASRPQVAKKQTGGTLLNATSESTRIAKKSTTHERLIYNLMSDEFSNNVLQSQLGQREVHMIDTKEHYKYYDHICSTSCRNLMEDDFSKYKGENPLRIPTLCGWERQVVKQRTASKRAVFYRAPCSRRLRSIEEVNRYLWYTNSRLTIDLFCFDSDVHTFSEFIPSKVLFYIPDVSYGKEDIPVPCVNSLYNEEPIYVPYSTVRFPAKGVQLNLDPEFLCGCDCEDNCQDSSKCSCQQLTINATEALPSGKISDAGYKYRRLKEPLITGIYECNVKCKCGPSCMNRVVQNGLQVRLQLFRTERKGWGIRCLDDIPQGMFICIYAGQLLTEQGANEDGHQYGDEYLAELDHIEVVERLKEGYESDVVEPDNDTEYSDSDDDSSEDSSSSSLESAPPRKSKYESDSDFDIDIKEPFESAPHTFRLRTRKVPNADDNSSMSEGSFPTDASSNLVPAVSEEVYLSPPTLARQPSNSLDEQDKDMSPLGINTSENGACNPPVLSPNLPEVKKVTVPWSSALPSNKKSDKDSISEDSSTNDEEPKVVKSLFGNLPDPKSGPLVSKTEVEENSSMISVRKYFSEEYCYIMDAKNCGNIGRYLNHSCNPNVFVQNVFVDTHDLRFPWVAFFAMVYIRAGSELTWDYNYDVGSVPGKVMYCYCASAECRGRLL